MALPEWTTGIVTRVLDETFNTKRFFIQIPDLTAFDFEPGQFVTLDLPIHEQKNKRWRSYSIASYPDGTNTFELIIVLNEAGAGTPWLWQNATEGASLTLRGPQGKFTLPLPLQQDLYLICTGTGIAPFRSMVHHIHRQQMAHEHIYLFYGCRKFTDTLYENEMKQLAAEMPLFTYLPTFSREVPGENGLYQTGYVHNLYEKQIQSNAMQHQQNGFSGLKPAKFMLCGWKNMIDEARNRIAGIGYEKKDIHFELYG
jgi:ferredoxin-NADP reductase